MEKNLQSDHLGIGLETAFTNHGDEDSGICNQDGLLKRKSQTVSHLKEIGEVRRNEKKSVVQQAKDVFCGFFSFMKCKEGLRSTVPILKWLPKYNPKTDLMKDVVVGLTISVLHIPQGMAYGMLAALPPINGLYTSFLAPIFYCLFGTSHHISMGTMAVVALMTGSIVETVATHHYQPSTINLLNTSFIFNSSNGTSDPLTDRDTDPEFVQLKIAVAASACLLIGLMQLVLGFIRFGFIATFMSQPLTRGFTTGCACYVFTAQIKYITGIQVPRQRGLFNLSKTYLEMFKIITLINWASVIMGLVSIIILYSFKALISPAIKKKLWKNMPMPIPIDLCVVILGTIVSWSIDLHGSYNVRIVGVIPAGLPKLSIPTPIYWTDMFVDCIALALVAFAIAISMGKIMAKRNNYEIDANQELIAYGITNSANALFGCEPSSSAFSRTLLMDSLGASTQLAGIVSSCVLLVVLLAIGPLFETLPNCVLAAIIMVALRAMFLQALDLPKLWEISKWDFTIWIVTFVTTIILDVPYGLVLGIGFSLLTIIYRTQRPKIRTLGRIEETSSYEDVQKYNKAIEIPNIKICQLESFLYYGNIDYVKESVMRLTSVNPVKIKRHRIKMEKKGKSTEGQPGPEAKCQHIVLDCGAVTFADYPGIVGLEQMIKEYLSVDVEILLANCKPELIAIIERSREIDIPESIMYVSIHDAVLRCYS